MDYIQKGATTMGKFSAWREKRKQKKEARMDPYDRQELRLQMKLQELEPGTPEYQEIQNEIKVTNTNRSESRESRRRISKSDRGGIILKILGIGGTLAGIVAVATYEKDGMTFTGEKRTIMDTLVSTAAKFIRGGNS